VESAEVQRYAGEGDGASRTWDLVVKCRAGSGEKAQEYSFVQIDRKEKPKIVEFLKTRSPPVKVIEEERGRRGGPAKNYAEDEGAGGGGDDDDDDDDDEEDEVRIPAACRASGILRGCRRAAALTRNETAVLRFARLPSSTPRPRRTTTWRRTRARPRPPRRTRRTR